MKVLAVHPGPLMYTKIYLRLEPLGLELVAEAARRAGHAVRLLDLQVDSQRAYLIQVYRRGAGVFLFDPPAIGDLSELATVMAGDEWIDVRFSLPSGSYATSIMREIIKGETEFPE